MTDERIAELMGWHWPTSLHPDDMLAKVRAVVHKAVSEVSEARLNDRACTGRAECETAERQATVLVACPLCGADAGYTLGDGSTYRWWTVACAACGGELGECSANRDLPVDAPKPIRWELADEHWMRCGAHAQRLRDANLRAKSTNDTEILTWHPADTPPEPEICVLIGFQRGGWEPGYWDGLHWRSYRGDVFSTIHHPVSCWAHPKGPP